MKAGTLLVLSFLAGRTILHLRRVNRPTLLESSIPADDLMIANGVRPITKSGRNIILYNCLLVIAVRLPDVIMSLILGRVHVGHTVIAIWTVTGFFIAEAYCSLSFLFYYTLPEPRFRQTTALTAI